jgi:hypothetical protein
MFENIPKVVQFDKNPKIRAGQVSVKPVVSGGIPAKYVVLFWGQVPV